jgi:hypothetical protein
VEGTSCRQGCGHPAHTVAVACVSDACVLQSCEGGFADCDQIYENGCEVNLFSSVSQCGQCGYSCPIPLNAVAASCVKPLGCTVGDCRPGYGDCDGLAWNGCESNLATDVRNCGACGMACSTYFSMEPSCSAAACSFACSGELYDVDARLINGCETQDVPAGNHTQAQALDVGSVSACDLGAFTHQIIGNIPSDQREHPALSLRANDTVEDWYAMTPQGEAGCTRDLAFQLITTSDGLESGPCFIATFFTDQGKFAAETTNDGVATFAAEADAYTTPSTIYVKVDKRVDAPGCAARLNENVLYFINYHL